MTDHILSLITFFPLFGVLLILLTSKRNAEAIRQMAFFTSVITFGLSLYPVIRFDRGTYLMQFTESAPWIPTWGVHYSVGVDGISLLLVFLTTLLSMIAVLSSWRAITERVKEYMIALLVLETAMLGVFVSTDLFLFYVFWELELIPMFLLIGIWGGGRKLYAAVKFFLYTLSGSVLMLVAILTLYVHSGDPQSFDIQGITQAAAGFSPKMQFWVFWALFLGFAFKVPMFPFHTWLPDAHVEAPTAGSVILAGVLLKMGTYGFLRFAIPMCPEMVLRPGTVKIMMILASVAIIYGALVAMMQKDMKKLVAYSSVSHMGYVMLGIFAYNMQGVSGGILQMFNHGIITGALFLIVGLVYERRHTRMIADFGGIARVMPVYAALFSVFTLASIGLPGTNGFIGEFLILVGAFTSHYRIAAVVGAFGIILGAAYMLWLYQRVIFNPMVIKENQKLTDLNLREFATLLPLLILVFWIGFYPAPFLDILNASVQHLIEPLQAFQVVMGP
ncbi:MAG: NADH-quinone oxidoreductase subunit M [bacterium]